MQLQRPAQGVLCYRWLGTAGRSGFALLPPPGWDPLPLPAPRVEGLGTWAGYGPAEELGPEAALTCGV